MAEMDPRKQECFGAYLYGAGFFARDDNTLGMVTGNGAGQPHFCQSCPRRAPCEDATNALVMSTQPAAAERYAELMREARARDIPESIARAFLGRRGDDPYMAAAVENFAQGHADRGRKDGALIR